MCTKLLNADSLSYKRNYKNLNSKPNLKGPIET